MRKFVFSTLGKIIRFLNLPLKLEWKLYNFAELLFFMMNNIFKASLRNNIDLKIAEEFLNYENLIDKVDVLKNGFDDESKKLVDEIMQRKETVLKNEIISYKLFNPKELEWQKMVNLNKFKHNYPKLKSYTCETFLFHNGLKLLPENAKIFLAGKDVIDAGAFVGDSAVVMSKYYSFKKIYSFEPEEKNYNILKEVIITYELKNVEPLLNGVGSNDETININSFGPVSSKSINSGQLAEIVRIDDFVKNRGLNVGLIKMDIEGAEYYAVLGARETIKEKKPVLLISIYHTARDFFEIKPLLCELNPDYKFMVRKINPFSLTNEVVLIAY